VRAALTDTAFAASWKKSSSRTTRTMNDRTKETLSASPAYDPKYTHTHTHVQRDSCFFVHRFRSFEYLNCSFSQFQTRLARAASIRDTRTSQWPSFGEFSRDMDSANNPAAAGTTTTCSVLYTIGGWRIPRKTEKN